MPNFDQSLIEKLPLVDASSDAVAKFLSSAQVVDIAAWMELLPVEEAIQQLEMLELERRAEVFSKSLPSTQCDLAMVITTSDLVEVVRAMDADDRVDFFNRLNGSEQQRLMGALGEKQREEIHRLAAHDDRSVGAIMTLDFAVLGKDLTAKEALAELRRQAPDAETIYLSYVLDDNNRLMGSIRLHELVLADDNMPVSVLMEADPISASQDASREDVARLIARYDLLALPVVDGGGKLVGIVTHDDAADAMQAEMTEDFQKISTVLPFSQNMREASIRLLYSKRIVWLALLVFGNLFSGAGIAYFEETILAYVSLVFFLPLLIDSSGNAGAQSATLMVRALATGDVVLKDWRDLIARELFIAAALGATMALVVYPLGAWRGGADVALVVGLTMFLVVIIGSLVGMSLPFLLSRLNLDPATASGPLVTTISDATGVLIYFSIATMVLSL